MELSEIDPDCYQRIYWLAPDGEGPGRVYRLLGAAMEDLGRAGIGKVVMRNRQYLTAIRARDGALAMSTMRFADEIVDKSGEEAIPGRATKPDAKEIRLATQIIDTLASRWKPDSYRDTYTEEVRKLIKAHERGKDVFVEEAPAARTAGVAALEASLQAARSRKERGKARSDAADRGSEASAEDRDAAESPRGDGARAGSGPKKSPVRRPARRQAAKSTGRRAPAAARESG